MLTVTVVQARYISKHTTIGLNGPNLTGTNSIVTNGRMFSAQRSPLILDHRDPDWSSSSKFRHGRICCIMWCDVDWRSCFWHQCTSLTLTDSAIFIAQKYCCLSVTYREVVMFYQNLIELHPRLHHLYFWFPFVPKFWHPWNFQSFFFEMFVFIKSSVATTKSKQ